MDFTPDGYTEPLTPRPAGLAIGAVVLLAGLYGIFAWSACAGSSLAVLGALFVLNETGTRRIRVTRSKLLIEEESRVRGLLIGPRRSRVTWDEAASVAVAGDHVALTTTGGDTLQLARGGPANELAKLKNRIDQAMAPD